MSSYPRFSGSFEFVVDKVSKMPLEQEISSKPSMIGNLNWIIGGMKTRNSRVPGGSFSFDVSFECVGNEENSTWRCYTFVTLSIVSWDERTEDMTWTCRALLHPGSSNWQSVNLVDWHFILQEANHYIWDDKIIIRADMVVRFPLDASPGEVRSMCTSEELIEKSTTETETAENKKKIEFLEAELMNERTCSKKISKDLKTKSAKIEPLRTTIVILKELLKTEKRETDAKLMQIDLMNKKFKTEKISEELDSKSADLESSFDMIEEEIASLEESLKTQKLETAIN